MQTLDTCCNRLVDIAIFVSPTYSKDTAAILKALRTTSTIFIVHSVASQTALKEVSTAHPTAHLVALAPHVATNAGVRSMAWMLPILPVNCSQLCNKSIERSTFVVQGLFEPHRRNYTGNKAHRNPEHSGLASATQQVEQITLKALPLSQPICMQPLHAAAVMDWHQLLGAASATLSCRSVACIH